MKNIFVVLSGHIALRKLRKAKTLPKNSKELYKRVRDAGLRGK